MRKSPIKKLGFYFSELLITTGAYAFIIWYFASKDYIFSSYNREISWLIVILFGLGILMLTVHLWSLYREDNQITAIYERLDRFNAGIKRILQTRHTLSSEVFSNHVHKTLDEHFAILDPSLVKTRIYRLVKLTLTTDISEPDLLSSLLQQQEEIRGTRVRYIAGILIMIGLLGTFLGLVQAVKYLQHFFTSTESVDLTMLFSDMKQTLGGLDKAFGTSIGGITAYLVLGYMTAVLRTKQTYILHQIEHVSLDDFLPTLRDIRAEKMQDISTSTREVLQTIPTTLSQQIGQVFEEIIKRTIGGSSEDLKTTSTNLRQAAEEIQKGQTLFTETLSTFGNFLATFQEGREHLVASQEAIASGIGEFSRALGNLDENQKMLAASFAMMKDYMKDSETRLSALDDLVQHIHNIWVDNREVFEQVATTIQQEHGTLTKTEQQLEQSLVTIKTDTLEYFQRAQQGLQAAAGEHADISRKLLESHTLLTTLIYEIKSFLLDEQNGLRLLSSSLNDTFGEARFQYLQLSEHLEELYKRIHENKEQLSQVQETVTSIQQHLQSRRTL